MAKLIAFNQATAPRRAKPLELPPDDPLEGATWLYQLYQRELHAAYTDESLTPAERRAVLKELGARITSAMPHHEIAAARDEIRRAEASADSKRPGLGGKVTSAQGGGSRPLRSTAPRGK